jgi:hypothetical protein
MKFLLLCQIDPAGFADATPEDEQALMRAMTGFNQELIQSGVLLGAGQLDDPRGARRVHAQEGRIRISEGPGLPGPLQIGGYYLIDVPHESDATGWASKCPIAQAGGVEVRRVVHSPL